MDSQYDFSFFRLAEISLSVLDNVVKVPQAARGRMLNNKKSFFIKYIFFVVLKLIVEVKFKLYLNSEWAILIYLDVGVSLRLFQSGAWPQQ